VIFRPGDSGVGVGVAVGVGVGVGLGIILVGPFGVAVGVGLGVEPTSGVGETVGVGVGEEFGETAGVGVGEEVWAKALRGGTTHPATINSSRQNASAAARTFAVLASLNRTTQEDAARSEAVGQADLRHF
jgi:hypothetical protein